MFLTDYVFNGQAHGQVAEQMIQVRFDPGMLRPYWDHSGHECVTLNTGRVKNEKCRRSRRNPNGVRQVPVLEKRRIMDLAANGRQQVLVRNATALRKEEWLQLDSVVIRAARYRLRAWADLMQTSPFGGFNAMSKLILEHETMSDPGVAQVDIDGTAESTNDAPQFQLQGVPLPITHSGFTVSARKLSVSRNSQTPIDTTMGEAAGRRVAEMIEKTTIGNVTGITYGGNSTMIGGYGRASQVYGYINFPARLTNTTFYKPTGNGRSGTGWVPTDTLKDVLGALDQLRANKFFGPFMIYTSNDWDQYLDNDYILTGGNVATQTLRNRLRAIGDIQDVRRLDFLFSVAPTTRNTLQSSSTYTGPGGEGVTANYPFTMIFVQMTSEVAQAVNGMDITTVQWETLGGMQLNFKVMCIQVPRLRADTYGNCGIEHCTATN